MYYFVHSAFSTLKSYYSTHSPRFYSGLKGALYKRLFLLSASTAFFTEV